jgi:hypothetical protein
MADHDELGEHLKRDWFAGRAQQIYEELKRDFDRYVNDLHMDRMRAILEASGHRNEEPADTAAIAAANTVSTAEGVLIALAVYLARQEANTPER